MTAYNWYIFFLCLIVFIALTILFSVLISSIINLTIKLIRSGVEDEEIKKEHRQKKNKKHKVLENIISTFVSIVLMIILVSALLANLSGKAYFEDIPTLQAVKSDSMAEKHPDNEYLYDNSLNDQVQMFDLVFTYKMPSESNLKLYDIVVYEINGTKVMHRIVDIKDTTDSKKNIRLYTTQGDAINSPDKFDVKYDQMLGIYRGEHIPFIGSFIMFLQSPAGWLCILLVYITIIASPIIEKKIVHEKKKRLEHLRKNSFSIKDKTS